MHFSDDKDRNTDNARHVRVFGDNSLYQAVIDRLGLENVWTRDTNLWGFTLVGIEELIGMPPVPYPTNRISFLSKPYQR